MITIEQALKRHNHIIMSTVDKTTSEGIDMDRDDLAQEARLKIALAWDNIADQIKKDPARLAGLISTITYRTVVDLQRLAANQAMDSVEWTELDDSIDLSGPEEQCLLEETLRLMEEAMEKMPEATRDMINLRLDGMTIQEIADRHLVTRAAAQKRLERAYNEMLEAAQ